jgi:CRISPR-associated endoribonuclease Cas6
MHPVLLNRISEADPNMGKILHDSGSMSPFSLSPVMGITGQRIRENQTCWVRLSILNNELENAFLESLEKGFWQDPISLENHIFVVEDVRWGKDPDNIWTGRESYEEVIIRSIPKDKIGLRIETPMSFKRSDFNYPLPESSMIFGNLSRRWNLFSPIKFPENPDFTNVSYAFFDIKTQPYSLRKGATILGVKGKLTFVFKGSENELSYYHSLLRFAFYSGIGVKTTQGMGMVRIKEVF